VINPELRAKIEFLGADEDLVSGPFTDGDRKLLESNSSGTDLPTPRHLIMRAAQQRFGQFRKAAEYVGTLEF
jgi:hypothetical protein